MILVIVIFIFSDVMTKLNTDEWQYQFLGITLFTVVLNGTMTAIFQVSCIFILPLKGSPGTELCKSGMELFVDMSITAQSDKILLIITRDKVEKILKGSLDSIPSPSPSVKIKILGGKVCFRFKGKTLLGIVNKLLITKSLLTSSSNVLPYYLK